MSDEHIDHKAEALRLLCEAEDERNGQNDLDRVGQLEHEALVRSNLAIAEGQERVAEEIKALRESFGGLIWENVIPSGGKDRKLRVTHE